LRRVRIIGISPTVATVIVSTVIVLLVACAQAWAAPTSSLGADCALGAHGAHQAAILGGMIDASWLSALVALSLAIATLVAPAGLPRPLPIAGSSSSADPLHGRLRI
jgi:hypothetical protein